jgi:hypothetical protein
VKPVRAEPFADGMLQPIEADVALFELNVGVTITTGAVAVSAPELIWEKTAADSLPTSGVFAATL